MAGGATAVVHGYLAKDPETRGEVVTFSIPVQTRKDGATTWWRVATFGKQGQAAAQYLKKGSYVVVSGRAEMREYEGKQGKGFSLELAASGWEFGPKVEPREAAPVGANAGPVDDDLPF
jgi:single-stranded DNA-binding protein